MNETMFTNVPLFPDYYSGRKSAAEIETRLFKSLRHVGRINALYEKKNGRHSGPPTSDDLLELSKDVMSKKDILALAKIVQLENWPAYKNLAHAAQEFEDSGKDIYYINRVLAKTLREDKRPVDPQDLPPDGWVAYVAIEPGIWGADKPNEWVAGAYLQASYHKSKKDGKRCCQP